LAISILAIGFATATYAGNVTTSPIADGNKNIVAKRGTDVIFTATAKKGGEVTTKMDISSDGPTQSGSGAAITVHFPDETKGQAYTCTFKVTHKNTDASPQYCATEQPFAFKVGVPKLDFFKENQTPEVKNYIDEGISVAENKIELTSKVIITIGVNGISLGTISSSRATGVTFDPTSGTTADGKFETVLKTVDKSPSLKVKFTHSGTEHSSDDHEMLPAIYRDEFHITGYYTPNEVDFSGSKVTETTVYTGSGATRKRYDITSTKSGKEAFLKNIAIEGEGYFDDGLHAVVSNHTQTGTSNPIVVSCTVTTNSEPPMGTGQRPLTATSCAIVRSGGQGVKIPDAASINVLGRDNREAIDRVAGNESGGAYHIDLYMGFDRTAAQLISENRKVVLNSY